MTPALLLDHCDSGQLWTSPAGVAGDLAAAYCSALAVRRLRLERGESARGFKIGFTNRSIWARYNVFAPIWGTVYDSTLSDCDDTAKISLAAVCQPRIEPECVIGMRLTPVAGASLEQLFDAIDWIAPGFEIVQSHQAGWKFAAVDAIADGALHARLLVGRRVPVREVAANAAEFDAVLATTAVTLLKNGTEVEQGRGANVLASPLRALHHFLAELRQCPGAPELLPGDVVTTGTWTDAWPVQPGEQWRAEFASPLSRLSVSFE